MTLNDDNSETSDPSNPSPQDIMQPRLCFMYLAALIDGMDFAMITPILPFIVKEFVESSFHIILIS